MFAQLLAKLRRHAASLGISGTIAVPLAFLFIGIINYVMAKSDSVAQYAFLSCVQAVGALLVGAYLAPHIQDDQLRKVAEKRLIAFISAIRGAPNPTILEDRIEQAIPALLIDSTPKVIQEVLGDRRSLRDCIEQHAPRVKKKRRDRKQRRARAKFNHTRHTVSN